MAKTRGGKAGKKVPAALKKALANGRKRKESVLAFLRDECLLREDTALVTPSLGDIVQGDHFPDLQALLDAKLENDVLERTRLGQVARTTFPSALLAWKRVISVQLFDRLASGGSGVEGMPTCSGDEEKLRWLALATTMFVCTREHDGTCVETSDASYDRLMRYPYILAHKCLRGSDSTTEDKPRAWSAAALAPDAARRRLIVDLVRASGLDAATAIAEDMDAQDARLVCRLCLEKNLVDADGVGNWWNCLAHFDGAHSGRNINPAMPLPYELRFPREGQVQWVRLNAQAEATARQLSPRPARESTTAWRCISCPSKVFKDWPIAESHATVAQCVVTPTYIRYCH